MLRIEGLVAVGAFVSFDTDMLSLYMIEEVIEAVGVAIAGVAFSANGTIVDAVLNPTFAFAFSLLIRGFKIGLWILDYNDKWTTSYLFRFSPL